MFTFKSLRQVHATKYLSDFTSLSGNIKVNFRASVVPNQEQWCRSRTILPSTVDKLYVHIISNLRHLQKAIRYTSGAAVLILQMRTAAGWPTQDHKSATWQRPNSVWACAESSKHSDQLLISNHRSDKTKVWEPVKRRFLSSALKNLIRVRIKKSKQWNAKNTQNVTGCVVLVEKCSVRSDIWTLGPQAVVLFVEEVHLWGLL